MSHTWSSKRKVRKAHKCWGCCSDIPAGSVVEFSTTVDDGFSSAYWCATCQAVIDDLEYWQREDGFAYGDIKDGWPEAWEEAALENIEGVALQPATAAVCHAENVKE